MILFIVFLPLINFLIVWFFSLFYKAKECIWIVVYNFIILYFLCTFWFIEVCLFKSFKYITLGNWIKCGLLNVTWGFIFDSLSICMVTMVCFVSGSVHLYSLGYMSSDKCLVRFVSYLSLFTFFMLLLITSDNFIQLFFGWEGIGLCSYLLISFWNTRLQASKSSLKALIVNRIGDFGYICGIVLTFYFFRSVDFSIVFCLAPFFSNVSLYIINIKVFCIDLICIFYFLGCIGKSSQIGLHVWLPNAMEGPTPVSALIHAATLVTAGVFLIIRCSPIFEFSSIMFIVVLFGGLTAFFSATIAITQDDIKRVIAFSTCSQLGYMVFICGLSGYSLSLFHLINHAFFKALLFLSAGSIIYSVLGDQDMRKYGSLIKILPYTYVMMFIGFLCLAGFPFLSGFYSKDLILEFSFSSYTLISLFSYWLGTISACLTAFYSFRVMYFTFWAECNSFKYYIQNISTQPKSMAISLFLLFLGSVLSGYILKDPFIGLGCNFWGNSIFILDFYNVGFDYDFIPLKFKNIPLLCSIFGKILAICWNFFFYYLKKILNKINLVWCFTWSNKKFINFVWSVELYYFFSYEWYFDTVYNYYIGYTLIEYSYDIFYKLLDKSFIEIWGAYGLNLNLTTFTRNLILKQTSFIYHSSCLMLVNLFCLVCIVLFL